MRRRFDGATVFFAVIVLIGVFSFIWTMQQWSDCNASGGEYVRAMNGLYKCIYEEDR